MSKGSESVYNKWNISVVICDADVPFRAKSFWWPQKENIKVRSVIRGKCNEDENFKNITATETQYPNQERLKDMSATKKQCR
jgi:hypothetical protein